MSKATASSLARNAIRSEPEFIQAITEMFEEQDLKLAADFFEKLNVPRSTGTDNVDGDLPEIQGIALQTTNFVDEQVLSNAIQRYLDRHERKVKWHAGHPSIEGVENVLLLLRQAMIVTNLRLARLTVLMKTQPELTPNDWAIARELMNRSYLSFRNFLDLTAGEWIDAMNNTVDADALAEKLGTFYELVDQEVRTLEITREAIEEHRLTLTVMPEGFPPVKPPNYFGGDLMGRGPWKQFWNHLNQRAHHFRETAF